MHFSRLRVTGFKSFVDSTELWIEPGMTGIVGPNGCGKSNLVEALRWVMGENSARRMRGGEMDDVIFGGTDNRPARNLAEVALVLDNAERTAPSGFNDRDEIDVVRRIERGSGSLYRVNGAEVRARDVQTLFADLATGAQSTAMVSQGRIGALIAAKPTDRRHLLEEAAGITGLHSRRHEAELRLKAAETNLGRLDDVLGALEEQLKGLKKQARQANRYRNLSDLIRRAEAIQFHHLWKEATTRRVAAAESLVLAEDAVAGLTRDAAAGSTRQAEAAEKLPALREAEARAAAALQRLVLAREALEQEERRLEVERREAASRIEQIRGDMERESALAADAVAAVGRLDREAADLRAAQASEEDEIAAAAERLDAATGEVNRLEQSLTALTEKIAADEARQTALRRQIAEGEERRARIARRLEDVARERADAEAEIAAEGAIEAMSERVRTAREALETTRAGFDAIERTRAAAVAAESAARDALQQAESAAARLRAEEEALTALLTISDPDLWPPMIDALSVDPGYEVALAAALGNDLDAAADEAAPVHWRVLPPFATPAALPEGATPLSSFVKAPPALARRLTQVGVVDDAEAGRALVQRLVQGQRLVSRSGALWRWDGFTAAGEGPGSAATRLTQRNRLKELRAECDVADRVLAEARARFEAARAEQAGAADGERAARDAMRAADTAFQESRDAEAVLNARAAAARSRLAALAEATERLDVDAAETAQALAAAHAEIAALDDVTAGREAAARLRTGLGEARAVAADRRSTHDRLIREAGSRRQRLADIAGELQSWQRRADNAAQQLGALEERQKTAAAEAERLNARPAEIAGQRTALFERIDVAQAARNQAADLLAEAETALAEIGRALRAAEARLADAREERVRCRGSVEQIDLALAALAQRAQEHIDATPDSALEAVGVADDDRLPDRATIEARVERLKRERDTMGPVNLRAEAEAEELDERIRTMQTERDDLVSAISRLRQGISNLNREGRARLLAAYDKVDRHFQELFIRLFGGGRAHLALTEADDPLEAGLEIMASPPGKKLQTLSLLSGGEQALTAIALLFAVFLTNPAPICVLDEVDAPLDDANVERFCRLVSEIADNAQTRFLVVTHHRLTMSRMDRLYGVTMGERGVSQLVSVDLRAAERMRESA